MFGWVAAVAYDCLREQGAYSSPRVMSWLAFLVCLGAAMAVTLFLLTTGQRWEHYEAFLVFCATGAFGGIGGALGNKYVNGRWNSGYGQPYSKGGYDNATGYAGRTPGTSPLGSRPDI